MEIFDHIMVDLETLDNGPTSAITSIGALWFDPYADWINGDVPDNVPVFYKNVDIDSCMKNNMSISGSTIQWWMEQSEDARKSLFDPKPEKVRTVLRSFQSWIWDARIPKDATGTRKTYEPYYIWSHGATFDLPILSYGYNQLGLYTPWQFQNARDTRTLFHIAFNAKRGSYTDDSIKHNALDDAFCQVMWVQEAYQTLGLQREKMKEKAA